MADPSAGYSWWGGGGDTELWKREDNAIYQLPLSANVGIGVTNPSSKLEVIGTITAERVLGVDYPDITNPPPVPVQSDWTETDPTSLAYIQNKPPAINQIQSDWDQTNSTATDYIKNKPQQFFNDNGAYIDLNRTPTQSGTQISGQVTGRWVLDDSVSTDAVLCKYDENRFTLTRGLIIHNAGNYYEGSNTIPPEQIQDWADNRPIGQNGWPDGEPSGGRLWHAFPKLSGEDSTATVIDLPADSVWYDTNINGIPHRVREILDSKGIMSFNNLKDLPDVLDEMFKLDAAAVKALTLTALAIASAALIIAAASNETITGALERITSGIAEIIKDWFKKPAPDPNNPPDPNDPPYKVRVYWKDIRNKPFASSPELFGFQGDVLIDKDYGLYGVSSSAFSAEEDGNATVNPAMSYRTKFIDFHTEEYSGKKYFAKYDTSTYSAFTGQGISFADSPSAALDPANFVVTKNYIEFKAGNYAWRFTKDGISHKNQSGVFKSVLWWDGDGEEYDNYHVFAEFNNEQPESVQETPRQSLVEQIGGFFQSRAQRGGGEIQPVSVTPAVQPGTAQPSIIQRADEVFETVSSRATAVGRGAQQGAQETMARGALGVRAFAQNVVRGAKNIGRKTQTVGQKLENGDIARAAARAGQDLGRNLKRGVADVWRQIKRF